MPAVQSPASLERISGATLSGANRPIRLRLGSQQGVDEAKLIIKHVDGVETMCGGIEYRLLCVSTDARLPLKQFTAIPAELQFVTDCGGLRSVCGIVAQAVAGESDGGLATYLLVVGDALAIMEKRVNTRVFRIASEIDITSCVGEWISGSGHAEIDTHPREERAFVITELRVDAENNLPKEVNDRTSRLMALNHWRADSAGLKKSGAERGARYGNQFTCVRRGIPIRPAYDPRSDLPPTGAQRVIVVGPVGEEVYCDEHGRIKVRFPACRPQDHEHANGAGASGSDRDSAWVRVSGSWAGGAYGALSLPRAGDECLVTFLGGDPDKLVITGRVHNGKTPPPSFSNTGSLPGNRYVSGIKSREVGGSRYNQLRLDDTPGQISAQLAGEHGHSQLNLGHLTHPRIDGRGELTATTTNFSSD
jgi:uncharacterized protein involved in type VI secretion and phage assembly